MQAGRTKYNFYAVSNGKEVGIHTKYTQRVTLFSGLLTLNIRAKSRTARLSQPWKVLVCLNIRFLMDR